MSGDAATRCPMCGMRWNTVLCESCGWAEKPKTPHRWTSDEASRAGRVGGATPKRYKGSLRRRGRGSRA